MKVIDLLNKIANGEIENKTLIGCDAFFHDLIVYGKNLYFINVNMKEFSIFETRYVCESIENNYEFYIYKKIIE